MLRIVLSLFFLMHLASCNEKSGGIIPFKENTALSYINQAPRKETLIKSTKITSVIQGNGYTYVKLSSNPFFGRDDLELSLKINDKTGAIYSDEEGSQALLLPELKNFRKDYSWDYKGYDAVISSVNETVKAENRTFNDCIRIDYRLAGTFYSEIWIKEGVGIVKFAAYRTNPPVLNITYYVWND